MSGWHSTLSTWVSSRYSDTGVRYELVKRVPDPGWAGTVSGPSAGAAGGPTSVSYVFSLLRPCAFFQILPTMARRPRSSRAWHFVLSAARRDADARAVALAGSTNWGYDSDGQHSDSDSDPEYASLPSSIPSAVPVTGESFCDCDSQSEAFCGSLHAAHRGRDCRCGEEDEYFDWVWDDLNKSSATLLSCDNRKVNFHMEYSCGTAAIRGTKELGEGQHFWEIKMTSPVYGTDMMVGIGTSDVDLDKYHHTFCSLLGRDEDSWGLSYTGEPELRVQAVPPPHPQEWQPPSCRTRGSTRWCAPRRPRAA
ncbi:SPRY domain-containing SOCS box protein 3 isoform X6 [Physeter macrocephalus]|uniref:SPRY domain-containing SOCS box protein 3 isoform X6 n=1 Tax=Physeter macrocephalus TaxID=9755 RepID=A0A9W2X427_PHYMC|nr:SPRY domain-containing SOCS box protein 3 isoform X6 [Physeter catodon]